MYSRERLPVALVLANLLADRSKIAFSKSSYFNNFFTVNFYVRKTFRSSCKKYDKITISYTSISMKPLSYMYSIMQCVGFVRSECLNVHSLLKAF